MTREYDNEFPSYSNTEYRKLKKELKTSVDTVNELRENIDNIYGTLEWEWNWPVSEVNELISSACSPNNEQGKRIDALNMVVEAAKKYVYDSYEPKAGYDLVRFKRLEEALAELDKAVKDE